MVIWKTIVLVLIKISLKVFENCVKTRIVNTNLFCDIKDLSELFYFKIIWMCSAMSKAFHKPFFSDHKTTQVRVAAFNCEQLNLTLFPSAPPVVTASLHPHKDTTEPRTTVWRTRTAQLVYWDGPLAFGLLLKAEAEVSWIHTTSLHNPKLARRIKLLLEKSTSIYILLAALCLRHLEHSRHFTPYPYHEGLAHWLLTHIWSTSYIWGMIYASENQTKLESSYHLQTR